MLCHHEEVPDQMPASKEAYSDYKQAEKDAQKLRFRARARLGAVILRERQSKSATQDDVAAQLGVVVNQVRRYEASFRQWKDQFPDDPLEA